MRKITFRSVSPEHQEEFLGEEMKPYVAYPEDQIENFAPGQTEATQPVGEPVVEEKMITTKPAKAGSRWKFFRS